MFYYLSPIGFLILELDKNGLVQKSIFAQDEPKNISKISGKIKKLLDDYFLFGKDMSAKCWRILPTSKKTILQQVVFSEISKIKFGETINYSELAKRAGKEKAIRAVANICGQNKLAIFLPCHRVVAKNGSLGGYAWGKELKQWLLGWENSQKT